MLYINDIDMIYELAKTIENNSDLELSDEQFEVIYDKVIEIVNRNKKGDILNEL